MRKIVLFLISLSFTGIVFGTATFETAPTAQMPLLREGFVIDGTEGRLVGPDSNDVWFFEFATDVNDNRVIVKAGTKLQLLPSAALAKMIADIRRDPVLTYQLWGARITKYKGRNFIFPSYYLPLKTAVKSEPDSSQKVGNRVDDEPESQQTLEPELTDPNSVLSIPPDILKKLRARRQKITDSGQRITMDEARPSSLVPRSSAPSVVVDRTGFVKESRLAGNGRLVFVPDALGRNIGAAFGKLRLLPCEILELAELKQADQLERVRFRIAGITTEYEGEHYLLLQKATVSYNHGNFGW